MNEYLSDESSPLISILPIELLKVVWEIFIMRPSSCLTVCFYFGGQTGIDTTYP